MDSTTVLSMTSGTGSALLWLALVGIAGLAVVLYWPRRFSGPLTEHERRLARGRLHGRSLALTLAAPICAVAGFALLLPPLVHLEVASHVIVQDRDVGCEEDLPLLSRVSWTEETYEWVEAVCCEIDDEAGSGQLRSALLRSAERGFRKPTSCRKDCADLGVFDLVEIELSLVEVAARAYLLTAVEIDAGPRLGDPDPWDIMMGTLSARGIHACPSGPRGTVRSAQSVLRLARAQIIESLQALEVFAVVTGDACDVQAALTTHGRADVASCKMVPAESALECRADGQRAVRMRLVGDGCSAEDVIRLSERHHGLLLRAGHGSTPVRTSGGSSDIRVTGRSSVFAEALTLIHASKEFAHDLNARGLSSLRLTDAADILVEPGPESIVIRSKTSTAAPNEPRQIDAQELATGPFSWSGIDPPTIRCAGDRVIVDIGEDVLDPKTPTYDPTTFHAVMSTIVWAANVLTSSTCAAGLQPSPVPEGVVAQPLLSATEIDTIVAAMRRDRDALGLVLLALAVCSLALGLRRSVR
ncbi:hypothetical protein [Nannocystis punicea]|uniref:Aerotolerance regulator N-terminal domain-containing protein n=1 Tax=Nannocystis punicea TaxID=2995304 RepID=A0ABY7HAY0_9BACT|nr:hypothetical protein [Nannocystis poenicansa]WAS96411.1 hypothetical protein O0S08_09650 [Nannocystis poenicansa]